MVFRGGFFRRGAGRQIKRIPRLDDINTILTIKLANFKILNYGTRYSSEQNCIEGL